MTTYPTPTGPALGGNQTRRNRTSGANAQSKGALPGIPAPTAGTVPTALVSPSQAVAYAGQLAALRNQYLTDLAQNRLTAKAGVLAGKTAIAGINQQRNVDISGQENAAAGAGRLGGSYDLGQRSGIVAGAAGEVVAQQQAIAAAKQQRQLGNIQSANAYETGIYGVASDQAAAQAQAQAEALRNGLFDPNSANYKAIRDAFMARLKANGQGRGTQRRRGTGAGDPLVGTNNTPSETRPYVPPQPPNNGDNNTPSETRRYI